LAAANTPEILDHAALLTFAWMGQIIGKMTGSAEFVAWACFVLGALILLAGVVIGLVLGFASEATGLTAQAATAKVKSALTSVSALQATAVSAAKNSSADPGAEKEAGTTGAAAQSLLKEVEGIIGALPERLRFSGLLVLVGVVLMSVATVQFGGHSIF
jgi:4-amino-4-deoxy-L-arabinose transferase-like glycosyltransferase